MPYKNKADANAYMKRHMLARYYRKKQKMIDMLGGKCTNCGTDKNLEFDHIDPLQKSFTIGKLWSLAWEKVLKELAKCRLLCEDCHAARHGGNLKELAQ